MLVMTSSPYARFVLANIITRPGESFCQMQIGFEHGPSRKEQYIRPVWKFATCLHDSNPTHFPPCSVSTYQTFYPTAAPTVAHVSSHQTPPTKTTNTTTRKMGNSHSHPHSRGYSYGSHSSHHHRPHYRGYGHGYGHSSRYHYPAQSHARSYGHSRRPHHQPHHQYSYSTGHGHAMYGQSYYPSTNGGGGGIYPGVVESPSYGYRSSPYRY